MRSRNIKPGLFKNEDLAECSLEARWLFIGLWCLADREGRLENRPKRIKMEIYPADNIDVQPLLTELADAGMITIYADESLLWIPKFRCHQSPHYTEKGSILAPHSSDTPRKRGHDEVNIQEYSQNKASSSANIPVALPPESRIMNHDTRIPNPEGRKSAVSQSGESDRGGLAKAGDIAAGIAAQSTNTPPQSGRMSIQRILTATREPPEYEEWWPKVVKRLKSVGEIDVLCEALRYVETQTDIHSPAAFLNSKCRDALKKHDEHMPQKPKSTQ